MIIYKDDWMTNSRPINLMPYQLKVLERCLDNQLDHFFDKILFSHVNFKMVSVLNNVLSD